MKYLFKLVLALCLSISFGGALAHAATEWISCSANDCYIVNSQNGKLVIGTREAKDISLLTDQGGTVTGITIGGTTGDVVPHADGVTDLGTSAKEFQDLFIDGTAKVDVLTVDVGPTTLSAGLHIVGGNSVGGTTTALDADLTTATINHPASAYVGDGNLLHHMALVSPGDNTSSAKLSFFATDSTGTDANTAIDSGDDIGHINFYGADGTTYVLAGYIKVETSAGTGTNDMPGEMTFWTTPDGSATPLKVVAFTNAQKAAFNGQITSAATGDIGWAIVAGANTACNTTCTSACIMGWDLSTADHDDHVTCSSALADECLCAGSS